VTWAETYITNEWLFNERLSYDVHYSTTFVKSLLNNDKNMKHNIVGEGGKGEPSGFENACREAGVIPERSGAIIEDRSDKVLLCVKELIKYLIYAIGERRYFKWTDHEAAMP